LKRRVEEELKDVQEIKRKFNAFKSSRVQRKVQGTFKAVQCVQRSSNVQSVQGFNEFKEVQMFNTQKII